MSDVTTDAFTEFERRGWDRIPDEYHGGLGPVTARAADPLLDLAGVGRADRVLDVATGPGYLAARALARGAEVSGVDLSANILALARRLVPGADLRVGDAAHLPWSDAGFDVVLAALLEGAGLARVEVTEHAFVHRVASGAALWEAVTAGTVRTAALVRSAPPRQRGRVRGRFEALVADYAVEGGLDLPVTVLLAAGSRAA